MDTILTADAPGSRWDQRTDTKVFVEELEKAVPHFYQEAGQLLKAWTPPPKISKTDSELKAKADEIIVEKQISPGFQREPLHTDEYRVRTKEYIERGIIPSP